MTTNYRGVRFKKQNEPFSFEQTILSDSFIPLNLTGGRVDAQIVNPDTKTKIPLTSKIISVDTILLNCIGLDKGNYFTDVRIIFADGTVKYTDVVAIIVQETITV